MQRLLACTCAAFITGLAGLQQLAAQNLVIANARIIDGNGKVIDRGAVVIRDGKIAAVSEGAGASVPGTTVVNAQGMTVMPGFIESHRHIMQGDPAQWLKEQATVRMQEFLDAGFTTVLSAGENLEGILELRRRINAEEIKGPRVIAAGRIPLARAAGGGGGGGQRGDPARFDASRGPNRPATAATAIPREETLRTVQDLAKAGVDAFKMAIVVTPGGPEKDTLAIIAAEARKLGIPTVTHAVSVLDTLAAVEAGTTILAHTPHIGQLEPDQVGKIASSGIPMMSTLGVFVPTFAEDNTRVRARTGDDNVARFRDLDPFPMNTLSSAGQGPVNARLLFDSGLTYGYGTDTTFLPKDSLAHELRPLRLVFSRKDIIQIMTRNAAATIGRSKDLGTLEPGKLADIVILDGNPLADIDDLLKVKVVIKGGKIVADKR
jgi:imidazolonepropionase-like amidohydrolase